MGIGEWFGFGSAKEEPDTEIEAVPTREQLLSAVDRVEAQARTGKVPSVVMARLGRVTAIVRETIPRMDRLGAGSAQAYNVMATATDYLPEAIGGYLRLPRSWADSRPVDRGKTPLMILIDQLDLLAMTMDKIFDAINRADAEALVVHGRFLQEKFGHASTGGVLSVDPGTPLPPMPDAASPLPAQPQGDRQAPPAQPQVGGPAPAAAGQPDIRLRPPSGRQS